MRAIGVIALAAGVAATAASGATRPQLHVVHLKPFTVHGSHFHAGEHLRVVVTAKRRVTRRIEASRTGGFTLVVRRLALGNCPEYSVTVYGPNGVRAGMKNTAESCGADIGPLSR